MGHTSELRDILNGHFGMNLSKLACAFASDAQQSSRYRRLQRFFADFKIDYDMILLENLTPSASFTLLSVCFMRQVILKLWITHHFLLVRMPEFW